MSILLLAGAALCSTLVGVFGRAPNRVRLPVLWGAAVLTIALACELARWAHGMDAAYAVAALLVAPVVVIFGASAWAARRFYGWPNLGAIPDRLALVAASLLVGTMWGSSLRQGDIDASKAIADALAFARNRPSGPLPPTRLGLLDPPHYVEGRRPGGGERVVAFPLNDPERSDAVWMYRSESDPTWHVAMYGGPPVESPGATRP